MDTEMARVSLRRAAHIHTPVRVNVRHQRIFDGWRGSDGDLGPDILRGRPNPWIQVEPRGA